MPIDQRANGAVYGGVAATVYGLLHDEQGLSHQEADNAAFEAKKAYEQAIRLGKNVAEATRLAMIAGGVAKKEKPAELAPAWGFFQRRLR